VRTDETPFYLTRVECPVCKTVNEFETIKLGAYTESGRDGDFRPTGREWRNPRYQGTNPLLYFMATCSSCFYTREFTRRFREWKDDTAFRTHQQATLRQRHLAALADESGPLRALGGCLWPDPYPLRTAINKLLLGILSEEMMETPAHFDLGRWYLRIAWLFREMDEGSAVHPSPRSAARQQFAHLLRGVRGDLGSTVERIEKLRTLVESSGNDVGCTPDDSDTAVECRGHIHGLVEHAEAMQSILLALGAVSDRNTADNGSVREGGSGADSYAGFPSYTAYLRDLQGRWKGVPFDEGQALAHALRNYRMAYSIGRDIPEGNAQIQLIYMIGELSRRVGELDDARQFLNLTVRNGREWIHKLKADPTRTALVQHLIDLAIEQLHAMMDKSSRAGA